jgi:hypothetical protein
MARIGKAREKTGSEFGDREAMIFFLASWLAD